MKDSYLELAKVVLLVDFQYVKPDGGLELLERGRSGFRYNEAEEMLLDMAISRLRRFYGLDTPCPTPPCPVTEEQYRGGDAQVAEQPIKRRGRPPGSKNKVPGVQHD